MDLNEVSTPIASGLSPSGAVGDAYNLQAVFDGGTNADVKYGAVELYGFDAASRIWKYRRPTADSLPWPRVALLPGALVTQSSSRPVGVAGWFYDNRPLVACMSATPADALAIGQECGTVKDSFALKVGNRGFVIVGVLADSGGRRFALVRPFSSGGGSWSKANTKIVRYGGATPISFYAFNKVEYGTTTDSQEIYGNLPYPGSNDFIFNTSGLLDLDIDAGWGTAYDVYTTIKLQFYGFDYSLDLDNMTWDNRPTTGPRIADMSISQIHRFDASTHSYGASISSIVAKTNQTEYVADGPINAVSFRAIVSVGISVYYLSTVKKILAYWGDSRYIYQLPTSHPLMPPV